MSEGGGTPALMHSFVPGLTGAVASAIAGWALGPAGGCRTRHGRHGCLCKVHKPRLWCSCTALPVVLHTCLSSGSLPHLLQLIVIAACCPPCPSCVPQAPALVSSVGQWVCSCIMAAAWPVVVFRGMIRGCPDLQKQAHCLAPAEGASVMAAPSGSL